VPSTSSISDLTSPTPSTSTTPLSSVMSPTSLATQFNFDLNFDEVRAKDVAEMSPLRKKVYLNKIKDPNNPSSQP